MRRSALAPYLAGGIACLGLLLAAGCGDEDGGTTTVYVPYTPSPVPYSTGVTELAVGAATAGANQTVAEGVTVTLDASGSHAPGDADDPEGTDPTTYLWTLVSGPAVSFTADIESPVFIAPSLAGQDSTTCVFQVEIDGADTDTVSITVKPIVVDLGPEIWVGGYDKDQDIVASVTPAGTYSYRWSNSDGSPIPYEWDPDPTSVTDVTLQVTTPMLTDLKHLPDEFGILPIGAHSTSGQTFKCTVYDGVPEQRTLAGQGAYDGSAYTTLSLIHIERAMVSTATTTVTLATITGAAVSVPTYDSTLDSTVVALVTADLTAAAHIGEACVFSAGPTSYTILANTAGTLTLDGDASGELTTDTFDIDLVVDAYIGQDCVFATSGNIYAITDNDETTLTLASTAAVETTDDVFRITPDSLVAGDHTSDHVIFGSFPNKDYDVFSNTATEITVKGDASGEAADEDIEITTILVSGTVRTQIVGPTSGGRVVPVGIPCFLNGGGDPATTTYAWSGTGTLTEADGMTTNPNAGVQMFVPPSAGDYTFVCLVDGTDAKAVTVRAAKYVGVGSVAGRVPDADKGECAACHGGQFSYIGDQMAKWETSGHAGMFERFTSYYTTYDNHNVYCFNCHTVGWDETDTTSNDGFDDVAAAAGLNLSIFAGSPAPFDDFALAYPKVADRSGIQCENCHGPGSTHDGKTEGIGTRPGVGLCAQCHEGHGLGVTQWERSVHAGFPSPTSSRRTSASCTGCHAGQGLPHRIREGGAEGPTLLSGEFVRKGCATCHDTHSLELRAEGNVTLPNGVVFDFGHSAVCAHCHHSRNDVRDLAALLPASPYHSDVDAEMLAGTGAFEYTGWVYTDGPHTAGTAAKPTPARCNTCHMAGKNAPTTTMPYETIGGHTLEMSAAGVATVASDADTYTNPITLAGTREFAVDEGSGPSFVGLVEVGDTITFNGPDAVTDVAIEAVMSRYSVLLSGSGNFTGGPVTTWSISRPALVLAEACRGCHTGGWPVSDTFAINASDDWDGDSTTETVQLEIEGLLTELKTAIEAALLVKVGAPFFELSTSMRYRRVSGGTRYYFPGVGETNADSQAWDDLLPPGSATWEQLSKAAYNYYFVDSDGSGGIHNSGYAVNLLQSSLDDLGALPVNADPYVQP